MLPEDKSAYIARLQDEGQIVAFVEMVNDSPSLAPCDIGIAMGGGTELPLKHQMLF